MAWMDYLANVSVNVALVKDYVKTAETSSDTDKLAPVEVSKESSPRKFSPKLKVRVCHLQTPASFFVCPKDSLETFLCWPTSRVLVTTLWSQWWWASCTSLCRTTVTTRPRLSPCLQTTTLSVFLVDDGVVWPPAPPRLTGSWHWESRLCWCSAPSVRPRSTSALSNCLDCSPPWYYPQWRWGRGTGCLSMTGRPSGVLWLPVEYFNCERSTLTASIVLPSASIVFGIFKPTY